MWICFNDAFLSIVDKAKTPGCLVVRARRMADIARVFPDAEIVAGAGTDYHYRAEIPREIVAQAVADRILAIDYPNFKNSVKEKRLHSVYEKVWGVMMGLQR
ncbi:hypothetical protein [Candidatus Methylocalor cossyra]|uniref:Uncharacterized protein n=1 Tax=Candidatus Methylocalor cossyra TaxID=3108543 RepID=A0ABM9NJ21_9GAMM